MTSLRPCILCLPTSLSICHGLEYCNWVASVTLILIMTKNNNPILPSLSNIFKSYSDAKAMKPTYDPTPHIEFDAGHKFVCLPTQSSQHISHQSKPHTTQPMPSHKISHFLSHHRSHFQSHHKATGTTRPPFCLWLQGETIESMVMKVMQSQGEPLLHKILPWVILHKMWEPTRMTQLNCKDSQSMGNHTILPSMLISSVIGSILLLPLQIEVVWLSITHSKSFCITILPNAICCKTPGLMIPLARLWCLNTWFWIHGNWMHTIF